MVKNGVTNNIALTKVRNVLITQPKPESDKSPYFELARKYDLSLDFHPFIRVEGISSKDFRKQKIEIPQYTAVIFTSRNAIDHFFRMCEEMKVTVSQDTKYFCITESVALYLQKFILYRKRKVFYGADGTNKSMFDVINKHKENERFLYPCSENQQDNEIVNWLKANNCGFATPFMYRTISNDVREILGSKNYDIICFFTPSGVKSLLDSFPGYAQNGTRIGAFGNNTSKAIEQAGLTLDIKAPQPQTPSMVAALEQYLVTIGKKK
jgi:uroporphyrinogen-III synthase